LGDDGFTHLNPGQVFTFIGASDRGFTAVGGFLPPGAVSVEVTDASGDRHSAEVASGAWAAVLPSAEEGNWAPLVEFHDATGVCVHRRDRKRTFEERQRELLQRHAVGGFSVIIGGGLVDRQTTDAMPRPAMVSRPTGPRNHERPCDGIRLDRAPGPDQRAEVGASKLGGQPDLPEDADWPSAAGHRLAFLAQINLDSLPATDLPGPEWTGLLSVFCAIDVELGLAGAEASDADKGCRILRTDGRQPCPREWPEDLPHGGRFDEIPLWSAAPDHDNSSAPGVLSPDHQIFGTLSSVQAPVLDEVAAMATDPSLRSPELWALLLQLDEDPEAGFEWGDAGRLYICLPRADLAAGRVDRAFALTQSH
jgi:hypothetical protein